VLADACAQAAARGQQLVSNPSFLTVPPASPSPPFFMKPTAFLKTPFPSHLLRRRDSLRFGASLTLTFPNNNSLGQVKLALCLEVLTLYCRAYGFGRLIWDSTA
jgi:hypothetical protein